MDLGQGSSALLSEIFRGSRAFSFLKACVVLPKCVVFFFLSFGMTRHIRFYKRTSGPVDLKDKVMEQQPVQTARLKFPSFLSY